MRPETQVRLLRLLAGFPAHLEQAWDVPRGLSLPGMAEALGVVRSALNPPLRTLEKEGLVHSRQAHVIAGGGRKRTVVHLTEAGRRAAEEEFEQLVGLGDSVQSTSRKLGRLLGAAPQHAHLFGRKELVSDLEQRLQRGEHLQLVGLPGIGKTALLRGVAESMLAKGWTVRWAHLDKYSDVEQVVAALTEDGARIASIEAAVEALGALPPRTLLVFDELQEVHSRHMDGIRDLLTQLFELGSPAFALGVRAPSPLPDIEEIRVEALESDAAVNLLPEELDRERAIEVVAALGGHPLALHLWDAADQLPEQALPIKEFIEKNVLGRLSEDALASVDELAAAAAPLYDAQLLHSTGLVELDEAALLRWHAEATELHHLVRNVVRAGWDAEQRESIHLAAAEHWSERADPAATIHEAHHRVQAQVDGLPQFLEQQADSLVAVDSAAFATLVEDALTALPDATSLRLLCARVAVERGEREIAEQHLEQIEQDDATGLALAARLALQAGQTARAEELQQAAFDAASESEQVRMGLARIASEMDDRLPGGLPRVSTDESTSRLEQIDLKILTDQSDRRTALVATALIKHALHLAEQEFDAAAAVRSRLADICAEDDPLLEELQFRARWASPAALDQTELQDAVELLQRVANPLRREALLLRIVEKLHSDDLPRASQLFAAHTEPNPPIMTSAGRRLAATRWFWRGQLDSTQRLHSWREAIHRYRTAECSHAVAELTRSLHGMLH